MNETQQLQLIKSYAAGSGRVLKKAFNRRAPGIAGKFTALGKPMAPRTARKMTENPSDVRRRNILENTCLLLGACAMESPQAFEIVWQFLESFAGALRGRVAPRFRSLDEAFSELRYASAKAERFFFRGERKEYEQSLIYVDHSLKGVFAHLQTID